MKKYKILTVIYNLDIGGAQRAAQNFALSYLQNGQDSRVLPLYAAGLRKDELQSAGVIVYAHGNEIEESIHKINQWQPDIIHVHRWGGEDPSLDKILKSLKIKHTKIIETNIFSIPDNTTGAELVDVHCHLSKWCLWKWNLFLDKKSFGLVVPYLVIEDRFFKETEDNIFSYKKFLGLPNDKYIFGRIGQNSLAKFNRQVYLTFDRLYSTRQDIHLLVVGLPPTLLEEVKTLKSFSAGAITLVDKIIGDDQLRLAYNSLDCFFHYAAIGESFGMVLAEAQLCEVPIVSVSTPPKDNSQLEVIFQHGSSVVVRDEQYLYEVMNQYASGELPKQDSVAQARNYILDNYTQKIIITRLIKLFDLLLAKDSERKLHEEVSKIFITNLEQVTISDLKTLGYGRYSFKNFMFFLSPRFYIHIANFIYLIRKSLVKG